MRFYIVLYIFLDSKRKRFYSFINWGGYFQNIAQSWKCNINKCKA